MTKFHHPLLYPFLLAAALLLGGCATPLSPSFQEPEVEVVSLQPMPAGADGGLRFRINLRVFNPNDSQLALSGLYYALSLAGHRVMTGTSNNLPTIQPYGQQDIAVDASANLMGSMFAAAKLMNSQMTSVPYELKAKIGLRNSLLPSITVTKVGEVKTR